MTLEIGKTYHCVGDSFDQGENLNGRDVTYIGESTSGILDDGMQIFTAEYGHYNAYYRYPGELKLV